MIVMGLLSSARRSALAHPLFSAVVVVTLGLAIGANTAVFAIVDAVLLRPFNVRAPEQLVNIYTTDSTTRSLGNTSYPDYVYLRDHAADAGVVSGVMGYSGLMATITGDTPEVVFGELVTENYFTVSGARIALGRGFSPADGTTPGSNPVLVISDRLWHRRFNASPDVLGKPMTLNGTSFTVIGVAAPEFTGLLFRGLTSELWAPALMMGQLRQSQLNNRGERWLFVKARLAPGASIARATQWLERSGRQLAVEYPATNGARAFRARPTQDVMIAPDGDRVLFPATLVLLAAVGLIVIIASTNVANIMLARAHARQREIAVRLALGASRRMLIGQFVAESAPLAALGAILGLGLAYLFTRLLMSVRPPLPVPIALDLSIDVRVLTFTIALTTAAAAVFGLLPALQSSQPNLTAALNGANTGWSRLSKAARFRRLLLVPQIALSLVLLTIAGLFARSVMNASAVDAGFDVGPTATVALNLALDGYDSTRARAFYSELARRLVADGDARAVSVADRIPLDLYGNKSMTIGTPDGDQRTIQFAGIDGDYFATFGIPLVAGRSFTAAEVSGHRPVAIVGETMARRYWPSTTALGQSLRWGDDALTVVGVARDVKVASLGESPQPFVYRPIDPDYTRLLRVIVRSNTASPIVVERLRGEVRALDPNVAIFEASTMASHLDVMLFPYRVAALVSAALGLFGLLLSSVGVFGVVAFGIARRTSEFGIRLALGANRADIIRMVFVEQTRVGLVAIGIGIASALGVARLLSGVVFGIAWFDPMTFAIVIAGLTGAAILATLLPASRAVRISPARALREE